MRGDSTRVKYLVLTLVELLLLLEYCDKATVFGFLFFFLCEFMVFEISSR